MPQKPKPSYWAVIPSTVRYDESLPPNAKLLYGEITALCNARGYCFAENSYFAGLYGLTERTVRSLIGQLAAAGYVTVEIDRDAKGQVSGRKIVAYPAAAVVRQPEEENFQPEEENFQPPPEENSPHNNTSISNNTPKAPKGASARHCVPAHDPECFEKIWKSYSAHARNPGNRKRAVRAWDRLKPDADLIRTICAALRAQYRTDWWQRDIGVPHFSTWLNDARWEDKAADAVTPAPEPRQKEGWD